MTPAYTLQLGQASGQAQSVGGPSDAAMFSDYLADLDHGDDAVGFTETHKRGHLLARACREQGYLLHTTSHGDVALAIRDVHRVMAAGAIPGLPAGRGHTARPIVWATFKPAGTDELVTVHEAHWLRNGQPGHIALTQIMADAVASHADGPQLGFWMGDVNNLDRPHDVTGVDKALSAGDLVSCWDELGRYPDTHPGGPDSPIDVVGKYDPDRRVSCLRARRWHQLHTDHVALSAWYRISPVKGL